MGTPHHIAGTAPTRLLLVDDHVAWAKSLAEHLTRDGYHVSVEHDGLAAVDRLRRELPDVLITDYFLKNLDGGKLCQVAKALAGTESLRTIIMTAGSDRGVSHVRAAHADAVIAKNRIEVALQDLKRTLTETRVSQRPVREAHEVVGHQRLHPRILSAKVHTLKQYLDALHECVGDAVLGIDAQLRVYFVNRMAAELLAKREADVIARPVDAVLGLPADAELLRMLRAIVQGDVERSRPLELEIGGHWLRVTLAGLPADDAGSRALLIARDLSALKAEQEAHKAAQARLAQTEKLAAVGQLISGVSHEINNPLAALLPNLVFLREQVDTVLAAVQKAPQLEPEVAAAAREIPQFLADCSAASERIRTVVADLRTFSRPTTKTGTRTRVEEVLGAAISLASNQIRLSARLEEDLRPTPEIVIDRDALAQTFLNILINAVQALEPQGNPRSDFIRVASRSFAEGVLIEISNSGPPIPEEIRSRIFEPFFTTKQQGRCVGMGLSIAHETVRRHGGTIELSSEPDQPVTFRVWIPRDTGMALDEPGPAHRQTARGAHILVVDDEAILRNSFRRALESQHDVSVAASASEALERIAAESFDLVICDLIMPGMSGIELYEEVSRRAPAQAERFVFLTGGTSNEAARQFLARVDRPRAYKPVDVAELRRLVDSCLS